VCSRNTGIRFSESNVKEDPRGFSEQSMVGIRFWLADSIGIEASVSSLVKEPGRPESEALAAEGTPQCLRPRKGHLKDGSICLCGIAFSVR
jgi:hypothetical protein